MNKGAGTEIFPWRVAKVVKKNQKLMPTMEEDDMWLFTLMLIVYNTYTIPDQVCTSCSKLNSVLYV